ncbi:tetratricopeptide repeat protein, partial [Tamlana crocina]|nr:hypothetical protein [Tamlana crocina]
KENNRKVYKQLGTFFLEKGNKELALDYFTTALENEKDDFGLFREVISLMAEAGNYEQVKSLSQQALEIFPTQAWLFLMRGTAEMRLKEFKKAETSLQEGLDYLIDDPETEKQFYRQLAEAYKGMNEMQK